MDDLKTLISDGFTNYDGKLNEIGEKLEKLSNAFGEIHQILGKNESRVAYLEVELQRYCKLQEGFGVQLKDIQNSISELRSGEKSNEDLFKKILQKISDVEGSRIPEIENRVLGLEQGCATQMKVIEDSISEMRSAKSNGELAKKMREWAVEIGNVVEKIDEQLGSFLSFSVQSGFSNNFVGFLVQYHTNCGKDMTVLILTGCFLGFMAVPYWLNWEMLEHKFKMLDHHHNFFHDIENRLKTEHDNGNAKARRMLIYAESLDPAKIKAYYRKRMIAMGVFVTVMCTAVSVTSHYYFCDTDKASSVRPLLSLVSPS